MDLLFWARVAGPGLGLKNGMSQQRGASVSGVLLAVLDQRRSLKIIMFRLMLNIEQVSTVGQMLTSVTKFSSHSQTWPSMSPRPPPPVSEHLCLVCSPALTVLPPGCSVSARPLQRCDIPASTWPSMVPLTASLGSVL